MIDLSAQGMPYLVEFVAIKKSFIHAIGNSTSKSGGVVVFFDFPDRHGVDNTWESAVNSPRQATHWKATLREGSQLSWVVVTSIAVRVRFNQHIDNASEKGMTFFGTSLLVHREGTRGLQFLFQLVEELLCFLLVH